MATIILVKGDKILREIVLDKECVRIGRASHNDIVIDDRAISAEHAVIISSNNEVFLEDLNSTNGTEVNGQPVRKHYLQDGDVLGLAGYRLRYVAAASDKIPGVAKIKILNGPNANKETVLRKAVTTIGHPNGSALAIACRPDGHYVMRVAGSEVLLVNGKSPTKDVVRLISGDVIDVSGTTLCFLIE